MRGRDARFEDASRVTSDERRILKDLRRAERMGLDVEELEAALVEAGKRTVAAEAQEAQEAKE